MHLLSLAYSKILYDFGVLCYNSQVEKLTGKGKILVGYILFWTQSNFSNNLDALQSTYLIMNRIVWNPVFLGDIMIKNRHLSKVIIVMIPITS